MKILANEAQALKVDGAILSPLQAKQPRNQAEIMQNWGEASKPVVSIFCSTYNHESYIAEAIDSFLMQETDFPFEIIILDDCSTDKTISIIKNYCKIFPKIINPIFEPENTYSKGIKCVPKILKHATRKYIAICEGDDYWTDHLKLQKQVDFLEKNEEYVITYAAVEAFDVDGVLDYIGGATRDLEKLDLQRATSINTLTVCFRNVIQNTPPCFHCTGHGDLFLWSLLGAHGKGKFISEIKPSAYRVHDGGVFSKKSKEDRDKMACLTYSALHSYYLKNNNYSLSKYFNKTCIIYSLKVYGKFYYSKVALKGVINFIARSLIKKNIL